MSESASKPLVAEPVGYLQGHTRTWNDSWQSLYSSWNDVIIAFGLRQGLNQQSAQNVCQETMITLLRSHDGQAAGYDSLQGAFESWLWGVIRNRVKAERRRHNKEILIAPVQDTRDGSAIEPRPVLSEPPVDFARAEIEQERQAVWVAALQRVRQRVKTENFEVYAALLDESRYLISSAAIFAQTIHFSHLHSRMIIALAFCNLPRIGFGSLPNVPSSQNVSVTHPNPFSI